VALLYLPPCWPLRRLLLARERGHPFEVVVVVVVVVVVRVVIAV
jgi:hypothetical protein